MVDARWRSQLHFYGTPKIFPNVLAGDQKNIFPNDLSGDHESSMIHVATKNMDSTQSHTDDAVAGNSAIFPHTAWVQEKKPWKFSIHAQNILKIFVGFLKYFFSLRSKKNS